MEICFPVSNREEYDSIVDMLTRDKNISDVGWWDSNYLYVKLDLSSGYVCMSSTKNPTTLASSGLSLAQLLVRLKESPLNMGGFKTTIHEDLSVTVGCTTFSKEDILAFMGALNNVPSGRETLTMSGTESEIQLAIEAAFSMGYVFHRETEKGTSYKSHVEDYGAPCTVVFNRRTKDMYTYGFIKSTAQSFDAKELMSFISSDYVSPVVQGKQIKLHNSDDHIAFSWNEYRFTKTDVEGFMRAWKQKSYALTKASDATAS